MQQTIASLFLGILITSLTPGVVKAENSLDRAIAELVQSLQSEEMREIVKEATKDLHSKDALTRRKAVQVFADLQARNVMMELLNDQSHKSTVIGYDLFLGFELDSLPKLQQTMDRWYPRSVQIGGEEVAGRLLSSARMMTHVVAILRVDPKDVEQRPKVNFPNSEFTGRELVAQWEWLVKTAKEKRTLDKPIDELIATVRQSK